MSRAIRQVAEQLEDLIEGRQWEWAQRIYAGLTDDARVAVRAHLGTLLERRLIDDALGKAP